MWAAAACGVIALGALLRFGTLHRESLDGDELFSRSVALAPIEASMDLVVGDLVHPPAYYMLLRPFVAVAGSGEWSLRSLSLFSGLLLVVLSIALAYRLTGSRWAGVFAGSLVSLSANQIYYSQQARSYALYAFVVLLVAALLERAIAEESRSRWWVCLGIAAVGLVLTHYVGLFYLLASYPAVAWYASKHAHRRWVLILLLAVGALGVWMAVILPQYRANGGLAQDLAWIGVPTWYDLFATIAELNGRPDVRFGTSISIAVLILVGVAVATSALRKRTVSVPPRMRFRFVVLLSMAVLPPLALFASTRPPLSLTIWGARHLLPSQALLAVSIALTLWTFFRGTAGRLAIGCMIFACLQVLDTAAMAKGPFRVPYREVARHVRAADGAHAPIYTIWMRGIGAPVAYYLDTVTVHPFPTGDAPIPDALWLLFRPGVPDESQAFASLLARGWRLRSMKHFGSDWGTSAALLARAPQGLPDAASLP